MHVPVVSQVDAELLESARGSILQAYGPRSCRRNTRVIKPKGKMRKLSLTEVSRASMSKSGDLAQARRLSVHLTSALLNLPKASSRKTRARLDHKVGDHLTTGTLPNT